MTNLSIPIGRTSKTPNTAKADVDYADNILTIMDKIKALEMIK